MSIERGKREAMVGELPIELQIELLRSIYLACKSGETISIPIDDNISYVVSYEQGHLGVSCCNRQGIPDASALPFLQAYFGPPSDIAAPDSQTDATVIILYMIWANFDIDRFAKRERYDDGHRA